ncbi:MAG: transcriptional regulator NrdR [Puniceicoccales bacterium]|jgi:transcriptional repressor NrdR|nr:transcriptional regulator NrdR [Puniceicoccales bacterium]
MLCPKCQHEDTRVLDTRAADVHSVRRRRQCAACGLRFSTLERSVREEVTVEKRDGRVEEFDRQKIVASLQCALKKGNRRREEVEALAEEIFAHLLAPKPRQLTSQRIGEEVLRRLKTFDELAYARYLSVHQTFASLEEFQRRIQETEQCHGDNL